MVRQAIMPRVDIGSLAQLQKSRRATWLEEN